MQKILRKRMFRDLKENKLRYLALGLLIVLGMYIVIGLVGAADTVIVRTAETAKANRVEDGQFGMFVPLTEKEKSMLEEEGITLEEHFYLDYVLPDKSILPEAGGLSEDAESADGAEPAEPTDNVILRVFSRREKIDLVQVDSGRLPETEGEILLERRFCEEHGISAGDKITVGSGEFTVTGIGTAPDYESPLRSFSDSAVDSTRFGTGFVTVEDYGRLREGGGGISAEEYSYAYLLNGRMNDRQLKEKLKELEVSTDDITKIPAGYSTAAVSKLTRFVPADDNPRIGSAGNDKLVDKAAGLAAGVIVLILFAYVISVFTVHNIEQESGVIGTLYAMGVKKKELLRHYLMLPVLLTFLAGAAGTGLGYSSFGVNVYLDDPYGYFSIPKVNVLYEPYLLLYGLFMPPLAAALTNYLVIRKKLNRPPLALIRGEQKKDRVTTIRLTGGFVRVFQIRQLLRERRTAVTVFLGMLISLLIVMLSLDCHVLCSHVKTENARDTRFAWMYTYKYPEEEVPEDGEEAYGVTMKKEVLGYRFDVTLLGIHEGNPYFDAPVEKGEDRVLISSAMAQKYGIDEGDILTLLEEEEERYYAFRVDGIVTCSAGFFAFMDIDSMRELMGKSENYYNIVFSDHALDIDNRRLYTALSKEEVEKSAAVFVELMKGMVTMLLVVSALIFAVVMYLMMKVMIDRSALSVSLFKIFGYRKKEIRRLYLNGNFFVVAVSALAGIPLAKAVMDLLFPYMVANVACGIDLSFSWQMYGGIFSGVLILYGIMNGLLIRRVNRILPAQVLKRRE